jgi:hypothetical protein
MNPTVVIGYLISLINAALTAIPVGTALYDKFVAHRTQAEQWAASGYIPSDVEWQALNAEIAADEAAIDKAATP